MPRKHTEPLRLTADVVRLLKWLRERDQGVYAYARDGQVAGDELHVYYPEHQLFRAAALQALWDADYVQTPTRGRTRRFFELTDKGRATPIPFALLENEDV